MARRIKHRRYFKEGRGRVMAYDWLVCYLQSYSISQPPQLRVKCRSKHFLSGVSSCLSHKNGIFFSCLKTNLIQQLIIFPGSNRPASFSLWTSISCQNLNKQVECSSSWVKNDQWHPLVKFVNYLTIQLPNNILQNTGFFQINKFEECV